MCRLCEFAVASSEYHELVKSAFRADIARVAATRKEMPESRQLFTNIPDWEGYRFNFALFEPLAAIANPENYYQGFTIDGERRGVSWSSGWGRSFGFTQNGKILLYLKATGKASFDPNAEWLKYFLLLEIDPHSPGIAISSKPPKFRIRADTLKIKGTNILSGKEDEHEFDFTFSHLATEKSAMLPEAVMQSAFYSKVIRHQKKRKDSQMQKSDFERYTITAPHFAPHPFLMQLSASAGYETRYDLQTHIPEFMAEHFEKLGAKPIACEE